MIIVSGCPRSGTSLMMNIMAEAYGKEKIMGAKFPREERAEVNAEKQAQREARLAKLHPDIKRKNAYRKMAQEGRLLLRQKRMQERMEKFKENPEAAEAARTKAKRQDETRDMNPNGFFECAYSVQGISYGTPRTTPRELADILANKKDHVCKIVSQGLIRSDPQFIDKIVFMVRNPASVAKSQERLKRPEWNANGDPELDGKPVRFNSPKMFCQVSLQAAQWMIANPTKPVCLVEYDELLDQPDATLARIAAFLGAGDFVKARSVIDGNLRRSAPESGEGWEWEKAWAIYDKLKLGDWAGIVAVEKEKNKVRPIDRLYCVRMDEPVMVTDCNLCKTHPQTRNNFRQTAIDNKIDWQNKPCGFDCLLCGKSVEDSIAENHWLGEEHIAPPPPAVCRYATRTDEQAIPNRPCMGCKIICAHPTAGLGSVPEKRCGKGACKHFTA